MIRKAFWPFGFFWFLLGFGLATLLFIILNSALELPLFKPDGIQEPLQATFLGQDGGDYAGKLCSAGDARDNVHIHLSGLYMASEPVSFRVDDPAQGGVWANPCDPVSNWFLSVKSGDHAEADLYFKPFRAAPGGTEYKISIVYRDGTNQVISVQGSYVKP